MVEDNTGANNLAEHLSEAGLEQQAGKDSTAERVNPPFLPSDISDNYLCCCRLWIERTEPAPSSSQSPPHLVFFVGMTHIN